MSSFDLLVLLALVVSGILGWYRGGLREAVTLLAIAAGFLAVSTFGSAAASSVNGLPLKVAALGGLFVAADLLVSITGDVLIRKFAGKKKGRNDRIAGALFGVVRGWVLAAFLLLTILVYHSGAPSPRIVQNSFFAPYLDATASAFLRKADVSVTELSNRVFWPISPSTRPAGA